MKTNPSQAVTADSLTLEEKASLGSGAAFWETKTPSGVPRVVMEDGPHGVRHQAGDVDHMGIAPSEPATCFPPAVALAQTWDPELVERVGEALGTEARSFNTDMLLGPGVNIKRDPRCGRNFEYFSEDPLLSGAMGKARVRGSRFAAPRRWCVPETLNSYSTGIAQAVAPVITAPLFSSE